MREVLNLTRQVSLVISLVFFIVSFAVPIAIVGVFAGDPSAVTTKDRCLGIVSFSFVFVKFSRIFVDTLQDVKGVVLPSVACVISLYIGMLYGTAFVFNLFKFPGLNIANITLNAIVTEVARMLVYLVCSLGDSSIEFQVGCFFTGSNVLFRSFVGVTAPTIVGSII